MTALGRGGPDGDQQQGHRPEEDTQCEVEREPAPLCEDECNESADETADPERRIEVADSLLAEVEHVECYRDDEDGRCARNDALRGVEPDERA